MNHQSFSLMVPVTTFTSYAATEKQEIACTLNDLAKSIESVTRTKKDQLPWLKLARFGDIRTEKNSLRHDANVRKITGIEVDYDEEKIPPDEAIEKLNKAGILSVFYTSPSHTEDAPRWRVLCPTSTELPPDRRKHLVGRINGVFGGTLANESWTLSQSFYYGCVNNNPSHRVEIIDGTPIDQLDDLDEIWIGPPNTKPATNGAKIGPLDEDALLQAIAEGRSYHEASVRLLGRWARLGVPYMEARCRLIAAMESVFPPDRDARWHARWADIDRCLEDIYGKQARAKDERGTNTHASDALARTADTEEANEYEFHRATRQAYAELREQLAKTEKGAVLPTHANLAIILKRDPVLKELVQYNSFSGRHMLRRAVPTLHKAIEPAPGPYPRAWDADDITRLLAYVQQEWAHGFRKTTVEECLLVEGRDREIHPVRDWLATLK